jgi:Family of unknown function (DUF6356)
MRWLAAFTEHPASVGETYGEHLAAAGGFGRDLILAGFACLVHALLPFLFEKTASQAVVGLHERMVRNRARRPATRVLARPAPWF